MEIPTAKVLKNKTHMALAAIPVTGFVVWAIMHLMKAFDSVGSNAASLAVVWTMTFFFLWWVPFSWFERPIRISPAEEKALDDLVVTVQVPVYNEDPMALRECLRSVFEQTRLPDLIFVVNDGSVQSDGSPERYSAQWAWFLEECIRLGIQGNWVRTKNQGKRHAQMTAFLQDDDADIFITLDSDSVLDHKAIAEGLKPFADPDVKSVAALTLVLNERKNALTWMSSMLYASFTTGLRAAQSKLGRVMVNSGTLAFYRAATVRKYADVYLNETFFGRRVDFSDDSMLTLFSMLEGDTVQQPSSVVFSLMPETFNHYRRQQMRWFRGAFIRMFWRLKYLPLNNLGFWMPLVERAQLLMSVAAPLAIIFGATTPHNITHLLLSTLWVTLGINYMIALKLFTIQRSDQSHLARFMMFLLYPLTAPWRMIVQRPMVYWAMVTCWKISWGTRQTGAEVSM